MEYLLEKYLALLEGIEKETNPEYQAQLFAFFKQEIENDLLGISRFYEPEHIPDTEEVEEMLHEQVRQHTDFINNPNIADYGQPSSWRN